MKHLDAQAIKRGHVQDKKKWSAFQHGLKLVRIMNASANLLNNAPIACIVMVMATVLVS